MQRDILIEKRKLILENIAFASSRMIKNTDGLDVRGVTEVETRWLQAINSLLHELDCIDMEIADARI